MVNGEWSMLRYDPITVRRLRLLTCISLVNSLTCIPLSTLSPLSTFQLTSQLVNPLTRQFVFLYQLHQLYQLFNLPVNSSTPRGLISIRLSSSYKATHRPIKFL